MVFHEVFSVIDEKKSDNVSFRDKEGNVVLIGLGYVLSEDGT